MAKKNSNPIILRADANIGNSSAEADDEFLFECFVDHPALSALLDLESSKLFASGRTGIGKTALLRMIEKKNTSVSVIDLPELALNYVSNSDIIQFVSALGVDLDLFYQSLWKHVFCIEYIRLRYNVRNEKESKSLFDRIYSFFYKDDRKSTAIAYLKNWESKFWITMDENIKEITKKIEDRFDAEFSGEILKFKGRAGYARTLSAEKRSALIARVKKIVNANLLSDLSKVMDLLTEYEGDSKYRHPYYILVDRIDENWVDESIRYQLIRALIECLRSFRKIRNLKIIVAIRSDVLERVIQENTQAGFQREKYDDYFLRIRWTKEQLWTLVEKRINFLFRRKYSSENVFFYDIFDKKVGSQDTFDYIIERTLMRPRDVISFINICLSSSQGESRISQKTIRRAESEYSRIRLQALIEEWRSAYPSLAVAFRILSGRGQRFKPSDIATKEFIEEFMLEVDEEIESSSDPLVLAVKEYLKRGGPDMVLFVARILFAELYRIGAIGVKLASNESYLYSFRDVAVISSSAISNETKVIIHPMLHRALNVSDGK
jgi:hypothetical protein